MRTPSWCALLKFAHGLLVSVHLEAYFIPKGVAVFHLPGTIAEIYTGMKFSRQYDLFQCDIFCWYHINEFGATRGNWSELARGSCKHPLTQFLRLRK